MRVKTKKENRIKKPTAEVVTLAIAFVIVFIWCLSFVYVLFYAVSNSLKTVPEYWECTYDLPAIPIFKNYIDAFSKIELNNTPMIGMIWNTIWMAFLGAFVNVLASTLVAYSVSKFKYPGRNFVYALAIFVQVVPILGAGSAGYKLHVTLGMINNPSLIWIGWLSGFDFAFLVLYGYFMSISETYSEAAEIDGAGEIRIMLSVVIPQAVPSILSLMLLQLIGMWNNYNISLLYMRKYPTLAFGLYEFQREAAFGSTGDTVYLAAAVMSMIPVFAVFAAFQKTIMNNVSVGGIKG